MENDLARELEKINENDLQPDEEMFEALNQEIEKLSEEGRQLGARLRELSQDLSFKKRIRQDICDQLWGHEFDEEDGYLECIHCHVASPIDPQDRYPDYPEDYE